MKLNFKIFHFEKYHWLLFAGIYFLAGGATFAAFSFAAKGEVMVSPIAEQPSPSEGGESRISFTGPKDQACPLNGAMFTKEEREIWEKRRPLLVMIENHKDSRPQSGLSAADVIYEAVAEGGITRFMAIFYCGAVLPSERKYNLGPVRSARTYFLDWASEYSDYPLYVHVGGAGLCSDATVDNRAKALCQIEKYGWKNREHWSDFDQFALSYKVCRREPERTGMSRATEHTMYCDSEALWEESAKRQLTGWSGDFRPWKFKNDASDKGEITRISFSFWRGYKDYDVEWEYQPENNHYLRKNGGEQQIDFLNNEPLAAKVVIIQFAKEIGPVDDHKHLLYQNIGQGKALVFQDAKVISGKWQKKDRSSRTLFFDSKGKEIEFNRGTIWIEILPLDNKVDYGSVQ